MAKAGLQFKKKDEYTTPIEVIKKFGPFDYDPATTDILALKFGIPYYDTIQTDGLSSDWTKYKKIWINPPFTRKFEFLKKAFDTVDYNLVRKDGQFTEVYFLLPADSLCTKKFYDIAHQKPFDLWIPDGRIKFDDGGGGAIFTCFRFGNSCHPGRAGRNHVLESK